MKLKIKYFLYIILIILNVSSLQAETLKDIANEINEIRNEIANLTPDKNSLPSAIIVGQPNTVGTIINTNNKIVTYVDSKSRKVKTGLLLGDSTIEEIQANRAQQAEAQKAASLFAIDNAISSLDEAGSFIEKSFNEGDIEGTIAAIAVMDLAISDIASNVPSEYESEIIEEGKNFTEQQMNEISNITKKINEGKGEKYKEFKETIVKLNEKGLNVNDMTKELLSSGIQAAKVTEFYNQAANIELKDNLVDTVKYSEIIGKSPKEVELSLRQVEAITSGDPKKLRAFEIEKYGNLAGISKNQIKDGINAVYNGDINSETKILKEIYVGLKNNPNYQIKKLSNQQLNKYMQEQYAAETAAIEINNSGINFGKGTNQNEVKKLANEIGQILNGKVANDKIKEIKRKIEYTNFTISDSNKVAAEMLAIINGKEYVNALSKLNFSTNSIAEQAAIVEATIMGNEELFNQSYLNKADIESVMSSNEVSQLTKLYNSQIFKENLKSQVKSEINQIQAALNKNKLDNFELTKKEIDKTIKQASTAMSKSQGLRYYDNELKKIVNTYNQENYEVAKNTWIEAVDTLRKFESGQISSEIALNNVKDINIDVEKTINDQIKEEAKIATTAAKELAQLKQKEGENLMQAVNDYLNQPLPDVFSFTDKNLSIDTKMLAGSVSDLSGNLSSDVSNSATEAASAASSAATDAASAASSAATDAASAASEAVTEAASAASEAATEIKETAVETVAETVNDDEQSSETSSLFEKTQEYLDQPLPETFSYGK
ncbi:hypothetical protein N9352_00690 [Candidatus Pelagibacter sp.]|nr:hypothetical protein [Candidatus Pelagibacter sp.]